MKEQVLKGRVIGGTGCSYERVDTFFGTNKWYGIPCSAVEKEGDRLGRIVHDYGFFKPGSSYSINTARANASVRYDSVRRQVLVLDGIPLCLVHILLIVVSKCITMAGMNTILTSRVLLERQIVL